jgi:Na+/H+-dicarboxylate symporter
MTERPSDTRWEQPAYSEAAPQAPVWGEVIVPGQTTVVVAPPSPQEQSLRTLRRLVFPVALVLAVVTGEWLPVLVLAIIVGAVLKRQLRLEEYRRFALATTLR